MTRYIDAEMLKKFDFNKIFDYKASYEICLGIEAVLMIVDKMPTADVQKVVKCKNCKFRYTATCFAKHETADDDYCSNGTRMDEGN